MTKSRAEFHANRKGYQISWQSVPAWVCDQCGEPFFESREVDLIQKAITTLDRETALLTTSKAAP